MMLWTPPEDYRLLKQGGGNDNGIQRYKVPPHGGFTSLITYSSNKGDIIHTTTPHYKTVSAETTHSPQNVKPSHMPLLIVLAVEDFPVLQLCISSFYGEKA